MYYFIMYKETYSLSCMQILFSERLYTLENPVLVSVSCSYMYVCIRHVGLVGLVGLQQVSN